MKLARGSAPWLLGGLLFALLATGLALVAPLAWIAAAPLLVVFLFMLWFFRDPERTPGPGLVSPADGRVLHIEETEAGPKLAIFMSPIDVHVNRAPIEGRIIATEYHRGSHVPAWDKESLRNERYEMDLQTKRGPIRVRLIAGTVARRIHPYLKAGAEVKKGQRIGLIAFGSRCELVLPPDSFRFVVAAGDVVKAGRTTIAEEVV